MSVSGEDEEQRSELLLTGRLSVVVGASARLAFVFLKEIT